MPGPRVVEPPVRTILPGQPELRIEGKRGGPLEMVWDGKVFTGTFEVHNVGTGNLMVTRVAVRQGDNGPWLPPGTSAQLEGNQ